MGWGGEGKGSFGGNGCGGGGGRFKVKSENAAATVWLGNIPPGITSDEIKANFGSAGTVKVVELIKQGKEGFAWFSTPDEARTAISMFNGTAINGQTIQVDPWTRKEKDGSSWSKGKGWGGKGGKGGDWGNKGGVMMPQFDMWGSSGGKDFGGKGWGGKGGKGWGGGGKGWGGGGNSFRVKAENAAATVWIGNVPAGVTPEEIKGNFEAAGTVKKLELIKQGKEGFCWFSSPEEAQNAIAMFNGAAINGQLIQVDPWTRKEKEQ